MISRFNKRFRLLLCVIDIYSKYVCVVPFKDKKGITITDAFQKSNRKPNKIWVDKGSKFYNRSIQSRLKMNDIEMHSTHNERFVAAESSFRTLKNKIYKYMTSVSKNVCISKLDD